MLLVIFIAIQYFSICLFVQPLHTKLENGWRLEKGKTTSVKNGMSSAKYNQL